MCKNVCKIVVHYYIEITSVGRCVKVLRKIAADYVVLHVGTILFSPSRSPIAEPHLEQI